MQEGSLCLSGPVLLTLTPLVAVLGTAITVLYRDGIKSRDLQITYLTAQIAEFTKDIRRLQTGARLMDEAETAVRTATARKRRS